jgi:hypothetical protein
MTPRRTLKRQRHGRGPRLQWDVLHGDFWFHRMLKTEYTNFVVTTERSASFSDDDAPQRCFKQ